MIFLSGPRFTAVKYTQSLNSFPQPTTIESDMFLLDDELKSHDRNLSKFVIDARYARAKQHNKSLKHENIYINYCHKIFRYKSWHNAAADRFCDKTEQNIYKDNVSIYLPSPPCHESPRATACNGSQVRCPIIVASLTGKTGRFVQFFSRSLALFLACLPLRSEPERTNILGELVYFSFNKSAKNNTSHNKIGE